MSNDNEIEKWPAKMIPSKRSLSPHLRPFILFVSLAFTHFYFYNAIAVIIAVNVAHGIFEFFIVFRIRFAMVGRNVAAHHSLDVAIFRTVKRSRCDLQHRSDKEQHI